jgi:hypothetical protein
MRSESERAAAGPPPNDNQDERLADDTNLNCAASECAIRILRWR